MILWTSLHFWLTRTSSCWFTVKRLTSQASLKSMDFLVSYRDFWVKLQGVLQLENSEDTHRIPHEGWDAATGLWANICVSQLR